MVAKDSNVEVLEREYWWVDGESAENENLLMSKSLQFMKENGYLVKSSRLPYKISTFRLYWFKQGLLNVKLSSDWFENEFLQHAKVPYSKAIRMELFGEFENVRRNPDAGDYEIVFDGKKLQINENYEVFVMVLLSNLEFRKNYDVFQIFEDLGIDVTQNSSMEGKILFPDDIWDRLKNRVCKSFDGMKIIKDKIVISTKRG